MIDFHENETIQCKDQKRRKNCWRIFRAYMNLREPKDKRYLGGTRVTSSSEACGLHVCPCPVAWKTMEDTDHITLGTNMRSFAHKQ